MLSSLVRCAGPTQVRSAIDLQFPAREYFDLVRPSFRDELWPLTYSAFSYAQSLSNSSPCLEECNYIGFTHNPESTAC